MSIPIRTRLYPKQGSGGAVDSFKKKADGFLSNSKFSKATSLLQNTPLGNFANSVTNSNYLENMANRGISQIGDAVSNKIGDALGKAGGKIGGIIGGELGSLSSNKLSSFLNGKAGVGASGSWYVGPAQVLATTNGLTFPVTPTVTLGSSVNYETYDLVHSNYGALAYKSSSPDQITITGRFPVNSRDEADYFIGCLHFLRSITKSHFGENDDSKGVPPPVMMFDSMGPHLYQAVPVVVVNFATSFEEGCDNVVSSSGTYVPTLSTLTVTLAPYFDPSQVSSQFHIDEFKRGNLLNKGYI